MLISNFTVVKSTPSGTIVRFTITDANDLLRTLKMVRAVIEDAFGQWLLADPDARTANNQLPGKKDLKINRQSKYGELTLTTLTGISSTGNITVAVPYSDLKCCGSDMVGTERVFHVG